MSDTENESDSDSAIDKWAPHVSWFFGTMLLLIGIGGIINSFGGGFVRAVRSILAALILIGVAVVLIPPIRERISNVTEYRFSRGVLIWAFVLGVVISSFVAPSA